MKNAIEISHLVKRYRRSDKAAVDDVSFNVKKGEFFALLGPNGAGKTTTISILSTTLSKTSGSVHVLGKNLDTHSSEIRRKLGVIFQSPSLDDNLSAEENIRFHAIMYGLFPYRPFYSLMPVQYRERVNSLAEVLGIGGDLNKPVKSFSGGMKRKLEIVRSLMHEPEILILDEPTTGLDPVSRKSLWDYLREVRARTKMTMLLTTHYLEEAEEADSVYIINHGKIAASGSPSNLKRKLTKRTIKFRAKSAKNMAAELSKKKLSYEVRDDEFTINVDSSGAGEIIKSIRSDFTDLSVDNPTLEEAYFSIINS